MISILDLKDKQSEFNLYDRFSVSPDRQSIAYLIHHKIPDDHYKAIHTENGTPYPFLGSELWIVNVETNKSCLVSSANSWRPTWSSSSDLLAFYADKNGFPQLWIYSLKENTCFLGCEDKIKSTFSKWDRPIWSKHDDLIYLLVNPLQDQPHAQQNNPTQLIRIFKSPLYETQQADQQPTDDLCLSSVVAIHLNTKQHDLLISSQHESKPAFLGSSDTGHYLSYLSSPQGTQNPAVYLTSLWIYNLQEKSAPQLISTEISIQGLLRYAPYLWVPHSDQLIFIKHGKLYRSKLNNNLFMNELLFDDKTLALAETIFQINDNDQVVISIEDKNPRAVNKLLVIDLQQPHKPFLIDLTLYPDLTSINHLYQFDSEKLSILSQYQKTGETVLVSFTLNETHPRQLSTHNLSYCCMSDITSLDQHRTLAYYEAPTQMGHLVILDDQAHMNKALTSIPTEFNSLTHYTTQLVTTSLRTASGQSCVVNAVLLIPPNKIRGVIVDVYPGSMSSKYIGEFASGLFNSAVFPHLMYLEQGYAVILPDMPLHYEGVDNLLDEFTSLLVPQLEQAFQSASLDSHNVGLIGHSFGAYGAVGILCKTTLFKAAVASAGIYDLGGAYGYIDKYGFFFQRRFIEEGQCKMGHPPWSNIQHYIENSPYYQADKIQTPLLLIHGEEDATCPAVESEKMFTALDRLGKKVELAIYKQEEHVPNEWKKSNYIDATQRVLQHFDSYLR